MKYYELEFDKAYYYNRNSDKRIEGNNQYNKIYFQMICPGIYKELCTGKILFLPNKSKYREYGVEERVLDTNYLKFNKQKFGRVSKHIVTEFIREVESREIYVEEIYKMFVESERLYGRRAKQIKDRKICKDKNSLIKELKNIGSSYMKMMEDEIKLNKKKI